MRSLIILIVINVSLFSCKTITLNDEQFIADIPIGLELIKIPAGVYLSGENEIEKNLAYDYMMMKYPITNAQYVDFLKVAVAQDIITIDALGAYGKYSGDEFYPPGIYQFINFSDKNSRNGFFPPDIYFTKWRYVENRKEDYNHHPVTNVTWFGANAYAKFYGMRLPTSAEWEKAAKANNDDNYPWGDTISPKYANYKNSGDAYDNDTTPVGYYNGDNNTNNSYSPFGIYDMAGNVWEWTSSWWKDSSGKVIKGGSWNSTISEYAEGLYVIDLFIWSEPAVGYLLTNDSREIGFRCVKDVSN